MNKKLGIGDALANVRLGDNAIPPDLPGKLWEPKSVPEYAFDAIREQVQEFEKELANFPGAFSVSLTSGGYAMAVDSIRLHGQFIVFIGCDDSGVPLRVVQHYTQVSMVLSKATPISPKKPIGFYTD